jgi:hypothetical protein
MLEATRRLLRQPLERILQAWEDAEEVWAFDDPLIDAGPAATPRISVWD